jgi:hypothetical protein
MSLPINPVQMINLPQTPQVDAAGPSGGTGAFQNMLE